jgi:predicted N-acetyltransferase YhbS
MIRICQATPRDGDRVRDVYLRALIDDEGADITEIAVDLLSLDTTPRRLSLVAVAEDEVVAHCCYSGSG